MTQNKYTHQHNNKGIFLSLILCSGVVTSVFSPALYGQQYPNPEQIKSITANWVCKWCPYSDKATPSGNVTGGGGYVSNDSFKHGDYTGLDEKGAFAIAAAQYTDRSTTGNLINIETNNLGLDSRSAKLEGGKQGSLYGKVSYQQIPKFNSDTARTPYIGYSDFNLPTGWTTGTNTQSMPQLAGSLHNVDIFTQRRNFSLHGMYYQNKSLSYQFSFERNSKEGTRTAGLALGDSYATARSVILAIPVDYVTNLGEIKLNYHNADWQAGLAYQFSKFNNGEHSITWQNAFSDPAGVTQGQTALEPNNIMQKVKLNARYQFSPSTYSTALLALGRLKQDDTFLPYTVNAALSPAALPTNSLRGKVNTTDATINLYSKISSRLLITAKVLQNDIDNDTERQTYSYVIADKTLSTNSTTTNPRANFPYSFRKQQLQLQGQYQIHDHDFSLSVRQEKFDRTYQEVDTTKDNELNAGYKTSIKGSVDVKITGKHSQRNSDSYNTVSEIKPEENSRLRKYNMADRKRNQLGISLNYARETQLEVGVYIDAAKDKYPDSKIGLQDSIQKDYGIALGYRFSPRLYANMDYTITMIESTQTGSDIYSTPNWQAKNKDNIDVVHLTINYQWIPKTVKLGIEYDYAKSTGDTKVSTAADFPAIRTKRHTFLISGDYRFNNTSTLLAFFRYEHYEESDWALDQVYTNTIPNILSLGDISPSYNIGVIGMAYKYSF